MGHMLIDRRDIFDCAEFIAAKCVYYILFKRLCQVYDFLLSVG